MNDTPQTPRRVRLLVTVDLDPGEDVTPEQIARDVRIAIERVTAAEVDILADS